MSTSRPVVDEIRRQYATAAVTRCCEKASSVDLSSLGYHVALKGERLNPSGSISDCIIFEALNGHLALGVVELKGEHCDAKKALTQISNGTKKAIAILRQQRALARCKYFAAVLVHRGWSRSESKVLASQRVSVKGIRVHVILRRPGSCMHAVFGHVASTLPS